MNSDNKNLRLELVGKESWGRSVTNFAMQHYNCTMASSNCAQAIKYFEQNKQKINLRHEGEILIFKDLEGNLFALYFFQYAGKQ
ncbi:hypothetical protein Hokovirus_3_113 [Hokovirus HKV1]|uniref:Uncharacterized protein n=1 Tax=Hokovirus HKV1 TaxID=1977638 RepID=A0A1V0SGJ0_9VIRU|nr:hypothetical protein Hokovirus_3_113 [Hokovirus HKV1]